ncbi:MAG: hypothetical protein ACYDEJ_13460 [Desulfitobacteriaceae bacterium]
MTPRKICPTILSEKQEMIAGQIKTGKELIQKINLYLQPKEKEIGRKASISPFCCYYDGEYKEDIDIEVCIPTKGSVTGTNVTSDRKCIAASRCISHRIRSAIKA